MFSSMELVHLCAVVVSTIAITSSVVESASNCNHTAVNDVCLKDFHSSVPTDKYLIDDKERKVFCKALRRFTSCFESTGCHESSNIEPIYRGFKNGLRFMCNETTGQSELVLQCWDTYGFQNAEAFCAAHVNNQTADTYSSNCEQKNDIVACLVKSVDKCCSPEAAKYAGQSILAMMVPIMKTKNCELVEREGAYEIDRCGVYFHAPEPSPPPGSNAGLVAAIVIIVLVVVIGVVVAVVLLVRKHRMAEWLRV